MYTAIALIVLASILLGFMLGKWREDTLLERLIKVESDGDKLVSYAIAQYNKVIEVAKDNTIVITGKFCPKKYREEMMDMTRRALNEFTEQEFRDGIEKHLGVTLTKTSQKLV